MAIVTKPLMFGAASGTLASALTYQMCHGQQIVRKKPHPVYPGTDAQLDHQHPWTNCVKFVDKYINTPLDVEAWRRFCTTNKLTMDHRNARIKSAWQALQNVNNQSMYTNQSMPDPSRLIMQALTVPTGAPGQLTTLPKAWYGLRADSLQQLLSPTVIIDNTIQVVLPLPRTTTSYIQLCNDNPRTGIILIPPSVQPPPPPPGPPSDYESYWKCDDLLTGLIHDASGKNNLTPANLIAVQNQKGNLTGALDFSTAGSAASGNAYSTPNLIMSTPWTMTMWLKQIPMPFYGTIYATALNTPPWQMGILFNKPTLLTNSPGSTWCCSQNDWQAGWHHVAIRMPGGLRPDQSRMRIDDQDQLMQNSYSPPVWDIPQAGVFALGDIQNGYPYRGQICMIRIYKRELTDNELSLIYNAEK